ncbi:hypothetical protein DFH94DRAFT_737940 [Russula ochroleuca]|jgi:hypothetical protein|uniref:Uncharacterized protein n=1 Tax=Russula ochroleuca TaxID=152965 RepID=A0A9P5TA87_9AGAM|nr:hypothetical protein DFH94DRAFT_737940 [Russula ochroleuca]
MPQVDTSSSTASPRDQRRSLPWRRHRMTDSHSGLSSAPQSSGRGGAGNIHTHPAPNERACTSDTPDKNRHRKPHPSPSPRKVTSYGRGGAGNVRTRHVVDTGIKSSPLPEATQLERDYLRARKAWGAYQPQSSGRGGAGNIILPGPIVHVVQILVSVTKL